MIKLYGIPASRAFRTIWMLEELGLDYENTPTHFATGDTHEPAYLELNPNGHIPTLVDGGEVFWESMAINLYLARRYDGGLQPKSVVDDAHAIQWSVWVMTEVEDSLITVLMNRAFLPEDQRDEAKAVEAEEKLAKPFAVLDGWLADRSSLVGDGLTVADVNVASVLAWTPLGGVSVDAYSNLKKWLDACVARPAAQKAFELARGA